MALKLANDATTKLAVAISDSDTALVVTTGEGAQFPALGGGDWCPAVLEEGTKYEIVRVTARSSDTLTVTRAQEGTTAQSFGIGARLDLRLTEAAMQALLELATLATAIGLLAPKASPTFTGTVAVPDGSFAPGKLVDGSARSVLGVAGNASAARADIVAGADHQALRRAGTSIGFGAIDLAQAAAVTGVLPAANLPDASTTAEGVVELATAAEYAAGTDGVRALSAAEVWSSSTLVPLTDAATIAVNTALGFNFGGASNAPLGLGGNRELGAPTNLKNQAGILWFTAVTSTRTLTRNAAWVIATGVEAGPYSITTSERLGIAYAVSGSDVTVTGILRRAA